MRCVLSIAGVLVCACRTVPSSLDPPPVAIPEVEEARRALESATDERDRFDLGLIAGADSLGAERALDRALEARPKDPELLLRKALLAEARLAGAARNDALLSLLERDPTSPEAEGAVAMLLDDVPTLLADRDRALLALDRVRRLAPNAPLTTLAALAASRLARSEDDARSLRELGGFVELKRILGPLGPPGESMLSELAPLASAERLGSVELGGVTRRPARSRDLESALPGTYALETFIEIPGAAELEILFLQTFTSRPGRIFVDGAPVLDRSDRVVFSSAYQARALVLSPGWHRLTALTTVSAASDPNGLVLVSLLTLDGRAVVKRTRSSVPRGESLGPPPRVSSGPHRAHFPPVLSESWARRTAEPGALGRSVVLARIALAALAPDPERAAILGVLVPSEPSAEPSALLWMLEARRRTLLGASARSVAECFEAAIRAAPELPSAHSALARALLGTRDEAALEHAELAVRLAPASGEAHAILAEAANAAGLEALAERELTRALATSPSTDLVRFGSELMRARLDLERAAQLSQLLPRAPRSRATPLEVASRELARAEFAVSEANLPAGRTAKRLRARPEGWRMEIHSDRAPRVETSSAERDDARRRAKRALLEALDSGQLALVDLELLFRVDGQSLIELESLVPLEPLESPGEPGDRVLLRRTIDWVRPSGHGVSLTRLVARADTQQGIPLLIKDTGIDSPERKLIRLALRRPDGTTIEPNVSDLSENIRPGDVLELAGLELLRPKNALLGFTRRFALGGALPIDRAELVTITPRGTVRSIAPAEPAPDERRIEDLDAIVIRRERVAASISPPAIEVTTGGDSELAPLLELAPWTNATQGSTGVSRLARSFERQRSSAPFEPQGSRALEAAFDWVSRAITPAPPTTPELARIERRGDRAGLFAALARSLGFAADLLVCGPEALVLARVSKVEGGRRWVLHADLDEGTLGSVPKRLAGLSCRNPDEPTTIEVLRGDLE
ncbi:MAG: hypothetical protein HYV07_32205 [Deltaproteobacteria bacterium]|nr:hypothetical protein [Deltaproteobacteria bacterium]